MSLRDSSARPLSLLLLTPPWIDTGDGHVIEGVAESFSRFEVRRQRGAPAAS